jgi:hypothetical protein
VPQAVGVVAVLVAGGDHQNAEAQDVGHAVYDTRGPRIDHAVGQAIGDAQALLDLAERQHAAIRGKLATVEAGDDGFAGHR